MAIVLVDSWNYSNLEPTFLVKVVARGICSLLLSHLPRIQKSECCSKSRGQQQDTVLVKIGFCIREQIECDSNCPIELLCHHDFETCFFSYEHQCTAECWFWLLIVNAACLQTQTLILTNVIITHLNCSQVTEAIQLERRGAQDGIARHWWIVNDIWVLWSQDQRKTNCF